MTAAVRDLTRAAPSRRGRPYRDGVRTDIQALRALAVALVVLYHLWPTRLSGGFVGVDVFLVISGFLITAHLLANPPRTVFDLLQFWSRRVRRLLPASLLVLLVTLAAVRLVGPQTIWADTAAQVRAAAFYFVNWQLADTKVDYLSTANHPTAVQHFWSLSVEEQFYLGWPVLILVLAALARGRGTWRLAVGMAAVVAASGAYSVFETAREPARAYFVTTTRIWELGVGGLLAVALSRRTSGRRHDFAALRLPPATRVALAWVGLAAIVWSALRYTGATPFPGWHAFVPVFGTAAVIAAMPPRTPGSPAAVMAWRPVQYLGDISYSVYLWHWPLVVLVPYVSGNHLGRLDKAAIIAATLVLAALTKRHVEDRFGAAAWGRPLAKPFVLAAVAMALVVSCAGVQLAEVHTRQTRGAVAVHNKLAGGDPCFGAGAIGAPSGTCPTDRGAGPLVPEPLETTEDKSDAWQPSGGRKDCFAHQDSYRLVNCEFGDPHAAVSLALVGNSHAAEWLPTVRDLATKHGWHLTTFLAIQCSYAATAQAFPRPVTRQGCSSWTDAVTARLTSEHYDLVVMANMLAMPAVGHSMANSGPSYRQGYQHVLHSLQAAKSRVVAIRDTPYPGRVIPDCLAQHLDDYAACSGTRSHWLRPDPLTSAVVALHDPTLTATDLTRYFCPDRICPAAIGGVPVYFDRSHISAAYAHTLAPYLEPVLVASLA